MPDAPPQSRRHFVGAALTSLGLAALAGGEVARAFAQTPPTVIATAPPDVAAPASAVPLAADSTPAPSPILAAAKAALERKGSLIVHHDVVGVADFGKPSSAPRFHLVDVESGRIESLLVAHGRGSDPRKTGWLSVFSNTPGSDATSEGAFVTGDYYVGEHGRSMRLTGLDPSNNNAAARGIVVHSAWYVAPKIIQQQGRAGCSEGCFAVNASDLEHVLTRLAPGRLLVATKI